MGSRRLEELKEDVYRANRELVEKNLVIYSFGNASGIDRDSGIIAIKPSGVDYSKLSPENMVLVDLN
jgi:L-ribulose-5-phosphate 4-epimerase